MSEASREMTLQEWMDRLPDCHYAYREHQSLKSQLAEKDSVLEWYEAKYEEQRIENHKIQAEVDELKKKVESVECKASGYLSANSTLREQLAQKDALIAEARPWVEVANKYYYINRGDLNNWLEKTKDIK